MLTYKERRTRENNKEFRKNDIIKYDITEMRDPRPDPRAFLQSVIRWMVTCNIIVCLQVCYGHTSN